MQEEKGVLVPDLYILVFKAACGNLDLFTYKNISQTCRMFYRLMKEHVPYKALEIETDVDEDPVLIKFYADLNSLLAVPRPLSLLFVTNVFHDMDDVTLCLREWWDENTEFTYVLRESNFPSVKPDYVTRNMLCILVDYEDGPLCISTVTWEMVRLILRASGRVVIFKCCDDANFVFPPIDGIITQHCSAITERQ